MRLLNYPVSVGGGFGAKRFAGHNGLVWGLSPLTASGGSGCTTGVLGSDYFV